MSSVVISGNTSGSVTLDAPAVAGSTTYTLAAVSGTIAPLVSGTVQNSTSGTSIDFTGIPSWAKRITVMFDGVSTSGLSKGIVQIGDAGGIENTGYLGSASGIASSVGSTNLSSGFDFGGGSNATYTYNGIATITLLNSATNTWVYSSLIGNVGITQTQICGGSKSLSATLDRIRITTVNGTDTFDAGSINIMYE